MASSKEDVFTLVVLHEEAEHFTDLVIRILLLVTCIDEIEEIMSACEVRTEGAQGACLVSNKACTGECFGQSGEIGIGADHDFTILILMATS